MNNLLRTLTESQSLSGAAEQDLKLLLNSVKEARKQCHDAKTSDAFYESLDGLLQDLRMVTMDNRDAEAFLKPVSKAEVPDYYDVIMHPMDLQMMQRKVKSKQYKSKREFKDDLDLIWSNCFTYNATENHPLRQCAARLKAKAEQLLKNVTDRKERLDPSIPSELMSRSSSPKINGAINGHAVARPRPVAFTKSPSPAKAPIAGSSRRPRRDVSFPESPAIVRTAEGMAAFTQLDRALDARLDKALGEAGLGGSELEERLKEYVEGESEVDGDDSSTNDGEVGEKRKRSPLSDSRPRKRARVVSSDKDPVDLWWDAMHSDAMLANGLPVLRFASSQDTADTSSPREIHDPPRKPGLRPRKKRKKLTESRAKKTLLYHMNNNIRTLRRIRGTHARLTVLKESNDETSGSGAGPGAFLIPPPPPPPDDVVDDDVDDRPWSEPMPGVEIGEQNADDCMHWMGSKVLEHVGFQGASSVALDVLAGVASDYLLTVGRNIHHLCDKYGNKMTPEEIILHTLFESGITRVYDLERYVKDDVVRFGARMTDLEKKLGSAYMEATSDQIWDDEALFKMEEEEGEDGEFVMGNFADSFGEDFLGLRELGIAAEFGLNSLTIPKRLLKGKNKAGVTDGPSAAKPSEPPPPFPPPPPFVPLDSKTAENQIGLLKPYYQQRMSYAGPPAPSIPTIPPFPTSIPGMFSVPYHGQPPQYPPQVPPIPQMPPAPPPVQATLPDDQPTPVHTKLGPLGQVLKSGASANTSKKKAPAKPKGGGGGSTLPGLVLPDGDVPPDTPAMTPATIPPETPKKPKASTSKKKKTATIEVLPPVIFAQ